MVETASASIVISLAIDNLEQLENLERAIAGIGKLGDKARSAQADVQREAGSGDVIEAALMRTVKTGAKTVAQLDAVNESLDGTSDEAKQLAADTTKTLMPAIAGLAHSLSAIDEASEGMGKRLKKSLGDMFTGHDAKQAKSYLQSLAREMGITEESILKDADSIVDALSKKFNITPQAVMASAKFGASGKSLLANLGFDPDEADKAGRTLARSMVTTYGKIASDLKKEAGSSSKYFDDQGNIVNPEIIKRLEALSSATDTVEIDLRELFDTLRKTGAQVKGLPEGVSSGVLVLTKNMRNLNDAAVKLRGNFRFTPDMVDPGIAEELVDIYRRVAELSNEAGPGTFENIFGPEFMKHAAGIMKTFDTIQDSIAKQIRTQHLAATEGAKAATIIEQEELKKQKAMEASAKVRERTARREMAAQEKLAIEAGELAAEDAQYYNKLLGDSENGFVMDNLTNIMRRAREQRKSMADMGLGFAETKFTFGDQQFVLPEQKKLMYDLVDLTGAAGQKMAVLSDQGRFTAVEIKAIVEVENQVLDKLDREYRARTRISEELGQQLETAEANAQIAEAREREQRANYRTLVKEGQLSLAQADERLNLLQKYVKIEETSVKNQDKIIDLKASAGALDDETYRKNLENLKKLNAEMRIMETGGWIKDEQERAAWQQRKVEREQEYKQVLIDEKRIANEVAGIERDALKLVDSQLIQERALLSVQEDIAKKKLAIIQSQNTEAKERLKAEKSIAEIEQMALENVKGQVLAQELLNDLNNRTARAAGKKGKSEFDQEAEDIKAADLARMESEKRASEMNSRMERDAESARARQELALGGLNTRIQLFERELDAVFRAGFRLKMVGMDLRFAGDRALGFINEAITTFADFEFNAARAASTLGSWATTSDKASENFDALKERIIDASIEFKMFSAEETAMALYYLGSTTGQTVGSIEQLDVVMRQLTPIMKAAAMTNTDYETTIKGVYSVVTQFYPALTSFAVAGGDYSFTTEMMTDVTEKLYFVTQKTAAEFPDLINSFKMVGPVAAQAGATFDDVAELLGRLADVGIRGTMSGRGLRQMFIQMVRPSPAAKKALEELYASASQVLPEYKGKSYEDIFFPGGKFEGTSRYIRDLAKALRVTTESYRSFILARISTANELPILTALVYDEIAALEKGGDVVSKISNIVDQAATEFAAAWSRLDSTTKMTMSSLDRAMEAIKLTVGGYFAKAVQPFIKQINTVILSVREWILVNSDLVTNIGQVVAIVAGFLTAAGAVLIFAGSLVGLGAAAKLVIAAFAPVIPTIGGALGVLGGVFISVINRWDEVEATIRNIYSSFREAASGIQNDTEGVANTLSQIFSPLTTAGDMLVSLILAILNAMANLKDTFGESASSIMLAVTSTAALILSFTKFGGVVKVISTLLGTLGLGLSQSEEAVTFLGKALATYFGVKMANDIAKTLGITNIFTAKMKEQMVSRLQQPNLPYNPMTNPYIQVKDMVRERESLVSLARQKLYPITDAKGMAKGAAAVGMVTKAVGGLKAMLMSLNIVSLLTSPLGMVLLVIPAIVAAFDFVSSKMESMASRIEKADARVNELASSFGSLSEKVKESARQIVGIGTTFTTSDISADFGWTENIAGIGALNSLIDFIIGVDQTLTGSNALLGKQYSVDISDKTQEEGRQLILKQMQADMIDSLESSYASMSEELGRMNYAKEVSMPSQESFGDLFSALTPLFIDNFKEAAKNPATADAEAKKIRDMMVQAMTIYYNGIIDGTAFTNEEFAALQSLIPEFANMTYDQFMEVIKRQKLGAAAEAKRIREQIKFQQVEPLLDFLENLALDQNTSASELATILTSQGAIVDKNVSDSFIAGIEGDMRATAGDSVRILDRDAIVALLAAGGFAPGEIVINDIQKILSEYKDNPDVAAVRELIFQRIAEWSPEALALLGEELVYEPMAMVDIKPIMSIITYRLDMLVDGVNSDLTKEMKPALEAFLKSLGGPVALDAVESGVDVAKIDATPETAKAFAKLISTLTNDQIKLIPEFLKSEAGKLKTLKLIDDATYNEYVSIIDEAVSGAAEKVAQPVLSIAEKFNQKIDELLSGAKRNKYKTDIIQTTAASILSELTSNNFMPVLPGMDMSGEIERKSGLLTTLAQFLVGFTDKELEEAGFGPDRIQELRLLYPEINKVFSESGRLYKQIESGAKDAISLRDGVSSRINSMIEVSQDTKLKNLRGEIGGITEHLRIISEIITPSGPEVVGYGAEARKRIDESAYVRLGAELGAIPNDALQIILESMGTSIAALSTASPEFARVFRTTSTVLGIQRDAVEEQLSLQDKFSNEIQKLIQDADNKKYDIDGIQSGAQNVINFAKDVGASNDEILAALGTYFGKFGMDALQAAGIDIDGLLASSDAFSKAFEESRRLYGNLDDEIASTIPVVKSLSDRVSEAKSAFEELYTSLDMKRGSVVWLNIGELVGQYNNYINSASMLGPQMASMPAGSIPTGDSALRGLADYLLSMDDETLRLNEISEESVSLLRAAFPIIDEAFKEKGRLYGYINESIAELDRKSTELEGVLAAKNREYQASKSGMGTIYDQLLPLLSPPVPGASGDTTINDIRASAEANSSELGKLFGSMGDQAISDIAGAKEFIDNKLASDRVFAQAYSEARAFRAESLKAALLGPQIVSDYNTVSVENVKAWNLAQNLRFFGLDWLLDKLVALKFPLGPQAVSGKARNFILGPQGTGGNVKVVVKDLETAARELWGDMFEAITPDKWFGEEYASWSDSLIQSTKSSRGIAGINGRFINSIFENVMMNPQNFESPREGFTAIVDRLAAYIPAGEQLNLRSLWEAGGNLGEILGSETYGSMVEEYFNTAVDIKMWEPAVTPAEKIGRDIINQEVEAFYNSISDRQTWKQAIADANKRGSMMSVMRQQLLDARALKDMVKNQAGSITAYTAPIVSTLAELPSAFSKWNPTQRQKALGDIKRGLRGQTRLVRSLYKQALIGLAEEGLITQEQLYQIFPGLKPENLGENIPLLEGLNIPIGATVTAVTEGENPLGTALQQLAQDIGADPVILDKMYNAGVVFAEQIRLGLESVLGSGIVDSLIITKADQARADLPGYGDGMTDERKRNRKANAITVARNTRIAEFEAARASLPGYGEEINEQRLKRQRAIKVAKDLKVKEMQALYERRGRWLKKLLTPPERKAPENIKPFKMPLDFGRERAEMPGYSSGVSGAAKSIMARLEQINFRVTRPKQTMLFRPASRIGFGIAGQRGYTEKLVAKYAKMFRPVLGLPTSIPFLRTSRRGFGIAGEQGYTDRLVAKYASMYQPKPKVSFRRASRTGFGIAGQRGYTDALVRRYARMFSPEPIDSDLRRVGFGLAGQRGYTDALVRRYASMYQPDKERNILLSPTRRIGFGIAGKAGYTDALLRRYASMYRPKPNNIRPYRFIPPGFGVERSGMVGYSDNILDFITRRRGMFPPSPSGLYRPGPSRFPFGFERSLMPGYGNSIIRSIEINRRKWNPKNLFNMVRPGLANPFNMVRPGGVGRRNYNSVMDIFNGFGARPEYPFGPSWYNRFNRVRPMGGRDWSGLQERFVNGIKYNFFDGIRKEIIPINMSRPAGIPKQTYKGPYSIEEYIDYPSVMDMYKQFGVRRGEYPFGPSRYNPFNMVRPSGRPYFRNISIMDMIGNTYGNRPEVPGSLSYGNKETSSWNNRNTSVMDLAGNEFGVRPDGSQPQVDMSQLVPQNAFQNKRYGPFAIILNMARKTAMDIPLKMNNLISNSIEWDNGGYHTGQSWANSFDRGMLENLDKTLNIISTVTIGDSPPKAGPLKNIDKGGYNIGNAWGSGMSAGAVESIRKGASEVKKNLDAQNREFAHRGNTEVTMNRNDKKQIQISLNVTGDGSANRATMSELRKGLMDALVMADLEHMVEVI